jgi:hypothetical protein
MGFKLIRGQTVTERQYPAKITGSDPVSPTTYII